MPRNRIIHDIQEIFVGSSDGEKDGLVTGLLSHQILKRLNLVQSFNYSVSLAQDEISVMGKSAPIDDFVNKPARVELGISYYLNGVNNEHRLGLNSANNSSPTDSWSHNIIHDMVHSSRKKDRRNIYLVINKDNREPNQKTKGYPFLTESTIGDTVLKKDIIDPKATGYGVVVFQNCYLTNYSVGAGISEIPLVDLSYVADNMIAYGAGSGINIPYLDLKKGEVTNTAASVYTSDFSIGNDGWEAVGGTLQHVHNYGGETYVLKFKPEGSSQSHMTNKDLDIVAGKKYKATGKFYIDDIAGNQTKGIGFYQSTQAGPIYQCVEVTGCPLSTWVNFSVEFVAHDDLGIAFYTFNAAGGTTFTPGPDDNIAFKDIVVTEVKEFIIPSHFKNIGEGTLTDAEPDLCSDSQVEALNSSNMEFSLDREGDEIDIYTSDFSTDTDGWGQSNGTKSHVINYGGETNVFRSVGNTTDGAHDAWRQYMFTLGKKYKISGKFYISNSSTTYKGMFIYLGSQTSYEGQKFHLTKTSSPWTPITIATWVDFEFEAIAAHENIYFYPVDTNGSSSFAATTADEFGLKDIVVTEIVPQGELTFHKETVQSCSLSFDIERADIELFGHKMYEDRIPTLPIKASMSVDLVASGLLVGSLLDNLNENDYYDAIIDFKNKSGATACKYKFSKAKLLSMDSNSQIGSNKTVQLSLETYMDFDDNYFTSLAEDSPSNVELGAGQRGLFISGKIVQLCAEIEHPESSINNRIYVLDEDGNIMESVIGSPQF